jgi:hypothetical protein
MFKETVDKSIEKPLKWHENNIPAHTRQKKMSSASRKKSWPISSSMLSKSSEYINRKNTATMSLGTAPWKSIVTKFTRFHETMASFDRIVIMTQAMHRQHIIIKENFSRTCSMKELRTIRDNTYDSRSISIKYIEMFLMDTSDHHSYRHVFAWMTVDQSLCLFLG